MEFKTSELVAREGSIPSFKSIFEEPMMSKAKLRFGSNY